MHLYPANPIPSISKLLLLVLILVVTPLLCASAQDSPFYPAKINDAELQTLAAKYETRYKTELAALPSKNKKDFENIYQQRWDNVKVDGHVEAVADALAKKA